MTAATTVRRALRPRHVHFAANYLWIVDETQPVAVLLEPDTHEVQKIVDWSALPARPPGTRAGEIVSDDHGLWVQSHSEGPLVRVTPNGIEHAEYTEHHVLLCAGPTGAWAVSLPHKRNDVARTRDTPPQRNPVPRPELLLAPPGGGVRLFRVEDLLAAVDFDEAALILGVEHAPWTRVPRTSDRGKIVPDEYVLQYSRSWLRVPFDQPIPDVITRRKYRGRHRVHIRCQRGLSRKSAVPRLLRRRGIRPSEGRSIAARRGEQSIHGVVPCDRNAACGADSLDLLGLPSRQKRLGVDRFGCLRLSGCDRRGLSARKDQEPVMGLVVCRINVTVVP